MVTKSTAVLVSCCFLRTHTSGYAISDSLGASNNLSVLGLSMTTGMVIAGVFLGIVFLMNRGGGIIENLRETIEYTNQRKHVLRKRVAAAKTALRKPRVVETLTDEQIPQVKKHLKEISILINSYIETIHQHGDTAVALAHRSGLTAGLVHYEREYARQVNMINAAVPRLISEADRISAIDEDYKQQIHDWILAMRKSLENCDPKHFERMARAGNAHSQRPPIDRTQSSL